MSESRKIDKTTEEIEKDKLTFDQEVFGVIGTAGYELNIITQKYKRFL